MYYTLYLAFDVAIRFEIIIIIDHFHVRRLDCYIQSVRTVLSAKCKIKWTINKYVSAARRNLNKKRSIIGRTSTFSLRESLRLRDKFIEILELQYFCMSSRWSRDENIIYVRIFWKKWEWILRGEQVETRLGTLTLLSYGPCIRARKYLFRPYILQTRTDPRLSCDLSEFSS